MNILLPFFVRFLLAPILLFVGVFVMSNLSKTKAKALKMVPAIVFILIMSIFLALPSLLGYLRYKFIWEGLVFSILIYLALGFGFNMFTKTTLFKKIGIEDSNITLLVILITAMIVGIWIYFLVFDYLIDLPFGAWTMLSVTWFIIPVLYRLSRLSYNQIPPAFYDSWVVTDTKNDHLYWENIDTFKLMQVTVKIKRKSEDAHEASFSVKIPKGIKIGVWFNRFIEDQNTRFPNAPIISRGTHDDYGWIFQTNKWLPFPMFKRVLDFEQDIEFNRIKNKDVIYINRVVKTNKF